MSDARIAVRDNTVSFEEKLKLIWKKTSTYELEAEECALLTIFLSKYGEEAETMEGSRRWHVAFSEDVCKVAIVQLKQDAHAFIRNVILSDTPQAFAATAAMR